MKNRSFLLAVRTPSLFLNTYEKPLPSFLPRTVHELAPPNYQGGKNATALLGSQ